MTTTEEQADRITGLIGRDFPPHQGRSEPVTWVRDPDTGHGMLHLISEGPARESVGVAAFDDAAKATEFLQHLRTVDPTEFHYDTITPGVVLHDRLPRPTPDGWA